MFRTPTARSRPPQALGGPSRPRRAVSALLLCLGVLLAGLVAPAAPAGAAVPSGFSEVTLSSSIPRGVGMTFAPDGRLFVLGQSGVVRIVKDGQVLPTPFMSIPDVDWSGERGVGGLAFDPGFAFNGYVYV